MNKSELTLEDHERISFAVDKAFGTQDWKIMSLLSDGLSGVSVYKIKVKDKLCAIKLENMNDKNFDLERNYEIVESVAKQGICPKVYFTDAQQGLLLMQYIEPKGRPETSRLVIKEFADLIRKLHDNNSFSKWKTVTEIFNHFYQKLPLEYQHKNIVTKCVDEINAIESILFNPNDIRSCHCDLNPSNVIFNGEQYFLVDWQAASPQSFYVDLACCSNWFYFYSEELCALFLELYLDREATEEEKAKYYLMRVFSMVYFGIGFISLPLSGNPSFGILEDSEIEQLPTFSSFMQSLGKGQVDLSDATTQQKFGFIFLKTAERMMSHEYYHQATDLLN